LFLFQLLNLENQLVEIELERNKYARTHDISAEHTKQLEENRKLLADEFVALKKKAQIQEENLKAQVFWRLLQFLVEFELYVAEHFLFRIPLG